MTKQDAIQKAGSTQALADLLKISRPAISQWGETIPQARIWQLMALRPEWFRSETEKAR